MINFEAYREKLRRNVQSKNQAEREDNSCEHEFRAYKQTLQPRDEWNGTRAYFILKACEKCKVKIYIDLKVER